MRVVVHFEVTLDRYMVDALDLLTRNGGRLSVDLKRPVAERLAAQGLAWIDRDAQRPAGIAKTWPLDKAGIVVAQMPKWCLYHPEATDLHHHGSELLCGAFLSRRAAEAARQEGLKSARLSFWIVNGRKVACLWEEATVEPERTTT